MTTNDMTGASDAEFEARIAPFEAEERVARAIAFADGWSSWPLDDRDDHDYFRRLAAAAIAALPPSPAEEAVKRVRWLASELDPADGYEAAFPDQLAADRRHVANRIRAALASPALAPHGEEG